MLSATAIATTMNVSDAIAVEPPSEKYATLGEIEINAAKANRSRAPKHRTQRESGRDQQQTA